MALRRCCICSTQRGRTLLLYLRLPTRVDQWQWSTMDDLDKNDHPTHRARAQEDEACAHRSEQPSPTHRIACCGRPCSLLFILSASSQEEQHTRASERASERAITGRGLSVCVARYIAHTHTRDFSHARGATDKLLSRRPPSRSLGFSWPTLRSGSSRTGCMRRSRRR